MVALYYSSFITADWEMWRSRQQFGVEVAFQIGRVRKKTFHCRLPLHEPYITYIFRFIGHNHLPGLMDGQPFGLDIQMEKVTVTP